MIIITGRMKGFLAFTADVFNLGIPGPTKLLYVEDDQFWDLFGEKEKRDIQLFKQVIKRRLSRKTH